MFTVIIIQRALFECFGVCVVKSDSTRKERFPVPFPRAAGLNESGAEAARKCEQERNEGGKKPIRDSGGSCKSSKR